MGEIETGTRVGDYAIQRLIANGGYGAVWLARHLVTAQPAAVKILHADRAMSMEAVWRFRAEASAIDAVRHPCVVQLYDMGALDDGRPYLVMEYVQGTSLAREIRRRGRFGPSDAHYILSRLCNVLAFAHELGVVHRDVSAGNILLGAEAPRPRVVLLDFGIAKRIDDDLHLTARNTVIGTASCMAPEQLRGGPVDARADVYALGVLTYYLLTGARPFIGRDPIDVVDQHQRAPRPRPSRLDPALAPYDDVVAAAMAIDPDERLPSVTALMFQLERAQRVASAPGARTRMTALDQPGVKR